MPNNLFLKKSKLGDALKINGTRCKSYTFNIQHYDDDLFEYLDIEKPESISNSVIKRRAEYLAGRYAALKTITQIDSSVINIPIGVNRSPIFPSNIIASISHANNTCICIASTKKEMHYLGIDVEKVLSMKTINEIQNSIINKAERVLLNQTQLSTQHAFTLVFSSKESLFKALHPFVQKYFDFNAAQLSKLCPETQSIEFQLTQNLHPDFGVGKKLQGTFHIDEREVLTCIFAPQK